jgi:AraC-like DNA-binding protein
LSPVSTPDGAASESLIAHLDPKGLGRPPGGREPECSFWSRPDGQLCVQYFQPGENVSYQPHTHSEYVIVLCLSGAVAKTQLGQTCVVGPGETMMGNFGVEHASAYLHDGKPCEAICLTVSQRVLGGLLNDFRLPPMRGQQMPVFLGKLDDRILHACAVDIANELRGRALGHAIVIEGLALRVLIETLRAWPRARVEACAVDFTPRLPRHDFVRAYEFMRWCRKDAFRLERLCRFLGSSEERFTRLFLAATNSTPASFYNQMLLEHGRDLLRDPALSVKEVSFLLGFKTPSHFIMAFRRQFGRSPQEYRHNWDGGAPPASRTVPVGHPV